MVRRGAIREIFHTPLTGSFNWDCDSVNAKIRRLYELGKVHNWNATLDVDWDAPCDMNDFPMHESIGALNGYPEYEALPQRGGEGDAEGGCHGPQLSTGSLVRHSPIAIPLSPRVRNDGFRSGGNNP